MTTHTYTQHSTSQSNEATAIIYAKNIINEEEYSAKVTIHTTKVSGLFSIQRNGSTTIVTNLDVDIETHTFAAVQSVIMEDFDLDDLNATQASFRLYTFNSLEEVKATHDLMMEVLHQVQDDLTLDASVAMNALEVE
jgi:hypothetical protein